MNTMQAAVLEPVGEGQIALQSVCVDAILRGLLSEVTVSQSYANLEKTNIEAVYTFPLPLDAVLMELTLELNGEILHGEVEPVARGQQIENLTQCCSCLVDRITVHGAGTVHHQFDAAWLMFFWFG